MKKVNQILIDMALILIMCFSSCGSVVYAAKMDHYALGDIVSIGRYLDPNGDYSLATAKTEIGAANKQLVINESITLYDDCNMPDNIAIKVTPNGLISLVHSDLILHGDIDAGLYQVFDQDANSTVSFGTNPKVGKVYPEWWGASGDNSTQCAPAIQAAIDSLSKGDIWFTAGTYLVNEEITLDSDIGLRGYNKATIYLDANSHTTIFYARQEDNIQISGLIVNGNRDNNTYSTSWPHGTGGAFILSRCSNTLIEDNRIIDCMYGVTSSGLGSYNNKFINNYFENTYKSDIDTYSKGCVISGNVSEGCDNASIQIEPLSTARDNVSETDPYDPNWVVGDYVQALETVIIGNTVRGATHGVLLHGGTVGCSIIGNTMANLTATGIFLHQQCKDIVISGNTIRNIAGDPNATGHPWVSQGAGIFTGVTQKNVIINNNTISHCFVGIYANGSNRITISNNICSFNDTSGICIYDLTGGVIKNNILYDNDVLQLWYANSGIVVATCDNVVVGGNQTIEITDPNNGQYNCVHIYSTNNTNIHLEENYSIGVTSATTNVAGGASQAYISNDLPEHAGVTFIHDINLPSIKAATSYGLALTDTTLQSAITAIGSNHWTLNISRGTWVIDSNLTFNANTRLKFEEGAVFDIDGADVTINGDIDAGLYQVFDVDANSSVSFGTATTGKTKTVSPRWFGALGDNSNDDTAAIEHAFASVEDCYHLSKNYNNRIPGATIDFDAGDYKITSEIVITVPVNITGCGARIIQHGNDNGIVFYNFDNTISDVKIDGIAIERNDLPTNFDYVGLWLKGNTRHFNMTPTRICYFGTGVMYGSTTIGGLSNAYHAFHDCTIKRCNRNVCLWGGPPDPNDAAEKGWANRNVFYDIDCITVGSLDGTYNIGVHLGKTGTGYGPTTNEFFSFGIEKTSTSNLTSARLIKIEAGERNQFTRWRIEQTGCEWIEFDSTEANLNEVSIISSNTSDVTEMIRGISGSFGTNQIYQSEEREYANYARRGAKGKIESVIYHHPAFQYYSYGSGHTDDGYYPVAGFFKDEDSGYPYERHRATRSSYNEKNGLKIMGGGQIVFPGIILSNRTGCPIGLTGDINADSNQLTFGSACSLYPGDRIIIEGADPNGNDFSTAVQDVSDDQKTVTCADEAGTQVTGADVIFEAYPGDTIILQGDGAKLGWVCRTASDPNTDSVWDIVYTVRGSPSDGDVITWQAGGYAEWEAP